jgi:hypothetical protein
MRTNDLVRFIKERENVRRRKEAGQRPFTKDSIIAKYRFCNVHREDDRVTRWLRENWYPYFLGNKQVWFAAVVARLLNYPESLTAIKGVIVPWQPRLFTSILHRRVKDKQKNFNAAYIVSTNGVAMDKVEYLVEHVLNPLWRATNRVAINTALEKCTLGEMHDLLMRQNGLGSFIAAQVVADLKYIEPWKSAPDWWTFAASGPGSRRGMNRVFGFDIARSCPEPTWRQRLAVLREEVNHKLGEPLHAQDLQNCLCEFDKYERARISEGAPKQIYKESE